MSFIGRGDIRMSSLGTYWFSRQTHFGQYLRPIAIGKLDDK
jgi:hypothetical protein